jgi:hypothetical protein
VMEPAATRGVDDLESVRTDSSYVNDMLAELDIDRLLRHWIPLLWPRSPRIRHHAQASLRGFCS